MIEFEALAPDTVEEMFDGLGRLELWTGKALATREGESVCDISDESLRQAGRQYLADPARHDESLEIIGEGMENSRRTVRILKAAPGYASYRRMIHYYGVKVLVDYCTDNDLRSLAGLRDDIGPAQRSKWVNVGGQLMLEQDVEAICAKVVSNEIDSWDSLHAEYLRLWEKYPRDKAGHALACLAEIAGASVDELDDAQWRGLLNEACDIRRDMTERTYASREKDYRDPFRQITFESGQEMDAVIGRH